MNKKVTNKTLTKRKVNKFDKGSWKDNWKGANAGASAAQVVGGVGEVAGTAINLAQPNQLTGQTRLNQYQASREAIENQNVQASSMSDLNTLVSNLNWADPRDVNAIFSLEEAGGKSGGEIAGGIISAAGAGAAAGATLGPWGALGGAVVGALGAGIGVGVNQANAKKQADLYALQAEREKMLYDQANRDLKNQAYNTHQNIAQNEYNNYMINRIANGGKINIKPSKRGTFTAAAKQRGLGVQEFASKVLANKDEYSTAMVRKANFAKNASKWKHSYGGPLNTLSGDFDNGLIFINEGGTHEQSPFEGVQLGIDNEGIPNLVEEGEVIFGDYVFSNRLKPTVKLLEDGGFSDKYENWTFAKMAEDLQKESAERPNDLVSMNGLNDMMTRLITMQEAVREKKKTNSYSRGGKVNKFEDGTPALPKLYDYYEEPVFTNDVIDIGTPKVLDSNIKVPFMSYYDKKGNEIKPTDPKWSKYNKRFTRKYLGNKNSFDWSTAGRYAPVVANTASLIANAFEQPDTLDYGHYDTAFDYAENIPVATYNPVGGKVTPDLMDPRYLLNQHAAERAALRRAISENAVTGSQAMMQLANADYNAQRNDADALLAFDRENWSRKLQAAQHNLGIDTTNLQAGLQTLGMNQTRAQQIVNAAFQRAGARAGIDQFNLASEAQKAQALSQSIGALSEDLAGIGTEAYWRKQIEENPTFMEIIANMNKTKTVAKNGGMLTKKRRK